jgi:hypothetical protein
MNELWQKGLKRLEALKEFYQNDPPRLAEISLAGAVGLQIKSTCNLLEFYHLREDMLFNKNDHLRRMVEIVRDEIENSTKMIALCEKDKRLGYHSEAEGYLFYPAKLQARIALLNELLEIDFKNFNINDPAWDEYTGRTPKGKIAHFGELYQMEENVSWICNRDGDKLHFTINNIDKCDCTFFLEINRNHPPFCIFHSKDGNFSYMSSMYPFVPQWNIKKENGNMSFVIDLAEFKDFIHPGTPLRMNIFGEKFAWVKHEPLPSRLLFGSLNYNSASWLI